MRLMGAAGVLQDGRRAHRRPAHQGGLFTGEMRASLPSHCLLIAFSLSPHYLLIIFSLSSHYLLITSRSPSRACGTRRGGNSRPPRTRTRATRAAAALRVAALARALAAARATAAAAMITPGSPETSRRSTCHGSMSCSINGTPPSERASSPQRTHCVTRCGRWASR